MELNLSALAGVPDQISAALAKAEQYARSAMTEEYVGTAAEGTVTATVSGDRELTTIDIHVLARRRLDNATLGEAVVAAVQAAEQQAADRQRDLLAGIEIAGVRVSEFVDDPMSFVPRLGRQEV